MISNIASETQNILQDLESSDDSVRLNSVKQLGNLGHPSIEILAALQKVKRKDKNKFIRYAAKAAIKRLHAIEELTGTDRPLSELSDREVLERLLLLQIENKNLISSTQSVLMLLLFVVLFWLSRTP